MWELPAHIERLPIRVGHLGCQTDSIGDVAHVNKIATLVAVLEKENGLALPNAI